MFEESRSFHPHRFGSASAGDRGRPHTADPLPARRGETALKAIAWSDLTARLDAARELRDALRHESQRGIADAGASFSDAAAHYFRTLSEGEPVVNLAALGEPKGSAPILSEPAITSATGGLAGVIPGRDDARDDQ